MAEQSGSPFLKRNGLGIALLGLFILFLIGDWLLGHSVFNRIEVAEGRATVGLWEYLTMPHFLSGVFRHWEYEFLLVSMYVLLTVRLKQKGAAASKEQDEPHESEREPQAHAEAPWSVRQGGWILAIYRNSLSIALILLFLASFTGHFYASHAFALEESAARGLPSTTTWQFFTGPVFWMECFEGWQGGFFAIAALVILSIWLRQHGSPESKPVDAPHHETGEGEERNRKGTKARERS